MGEEDHHPPPPLSLVPRQPGRPLRSSAVLEALVETAVMKVALLERAVAQADDTAAATRAELAELRTEVRATRGLLESHLEHSRASERAASDRQAAIMGMLGDVLARLPGG